MTNVGSITIDGRFARHQMEHGFVVAAAVAEHDVLVVAAPRAGRVDVVRVEWPGIRNVQIVDGAFRITDAESQTDVIDLHAHVLTGSLGTSRTTRNELMSLVTSSVSPATARRARSSNATSVVVKPAALRAGFGLAERWTTGDATQPPASAPALPSCRSINLDAFETRSSRAVLVLEGPAHGRGHLYLEHAPHGMTTFAVGVSTAGGCYFVTGPQRSGTTFLAHAISYDLGIQHIDEVDFQTFDYAQFREVAARSRSWVVQAPALFHHLADLQHDFPSAIPVVCRRNLDDIVASQRRINWGSREEGFERRHMAIPDGDRRPIAEIKYDKWDRDKHAYRRFVEVPYADLRQHPLYVETRSDFGAKRWS